MSHLFKEVKIDLSRFKTGSFIMYFPKTYKYMWKGDCLINVCLYK